MNYILSDSQANTSFYSQLRQDISARMQPVGQHDSERDFLMAGDQQLLPLASVIVLNFNGEKIIERCLEHLLCQSYPKVEIVVVDNASSDGSLDILSRYASEGRICLIKSSTNLGVAGGRNFGVTKACGDVIAFIDNDGYAHQNWLECAVAKLFSKPDIGAVSSLVFFNKRKIILNGAGGTINYRGYGADRCFNTPYESAPMPREVLYPMGCGMVLRREAVEAIGALDELLFNYYDDVEVGIRTWRRGFRVVLCPNAWVDHDFSYSDKFNRNKVLLCERNRIRNALKYFPTWRLPIWLVHETRIFRYLFVPGARTLPFKVWGWNIRNARSAMIIRKRFPSHKFGDRQQVYPSWQGIPSNPDNQSNIPDHVSPPSCIRLGPGGVHRTLNYGWYTAESDKFGGFRWTSDTASLYLHNDLEDQVFFISYRGQMFDQRVTFQMRKLGDLTPVWSTTEMAPFFWVTEEKRITIPVGDYELLVSTEISIGRQCRRRLGVAVRQLGFKSAILKSG